MDDLHSQSGRPLFLVSADIYFLLKGWARRKGFFIPGVAFFELLRQELLAYLQEQVFDGRVKICFLPWSNLANGLMLQRAKFDLAGQDLPIISLDKVYEDMLGPDPIHLEINRLMRKTSHGWESIGRGPRPGSGMLIFQLEDISRRWEIRRMQEKRVVLLDDGKWTGESLQLTVELLEDAGIQVERILAGFDLHPSQNEVEFSAPFSAVYTFEPGEVLDWVCERDFFPGVPFSGRALGFVYPGQLQDKINRLFPATPDPRNLGAPYVLPFGEPNAWGSIPQNKALAFSVLCFKLSINLFRQIEEATRLMTGNPGFIVKVGDLDRIPYLYANRREASFVDLLQQTLSELLSLN